MAAVSSATSTGNAYIDGIISGLKWSSSALTFSFPASASSYESNYGLSEPSQNFQAFTAGQRAAALKVLAGYSAIANVSFQELSGGSAASATIRYGETDKVTTAWAYTPTAAAEGGDVWIKGSSSLFADASPGSYAYMTLLHETGHAMGLKHAHEPSGLFGAMPSDHDSLEYTVMSYRSYVGQSLTQGYVNGTWDYPQTLMLDDVRALQTLYGANFSAAGTDVTYRWNPNTGEMSINGVAQGAPGGNKVFMTVWTGGANATYDFSNYKTDLKVDLQPGHWSTISTAQLAHLDRGDAHIAQGNIANAYYVSAGAVDDLVRNVIGGSGADSILGNAADNSIQGGAGDDQIDGGLGVNTAVYSGKLADYAWKAVDASSWTITDLRSGGPDGVDTLKNIAMLQFADQTVSITAQGPAPAAASVPGPTTGSTGATTTPPTGGETKADSQAVDAAALQAVIDASKGTISVANLTYQFFTGSTPTQAGLNYVVSSPENPANLLSAYYQSFSIENRYINFAVNLGRYGEGKAGFESQYGELDMTGAVSQAYKAIFGTDADPAKLAAILGDGRDAYFHALGGDDLGAKAAMVGWLMSEAVKADTGLYARANDAYIGDLMANHVAAGLNLIGSYGDAFKSDGGPYAPAEVIDPATAEVDHGADLIGLPFDYLSV